VERDGARLLVDEPDHANEPVTAVRPHLRREPTEFVEFHCLLVRTAVLRQLGGLDEGLLSIYEHNDFGIAVIEAGGELWIEPAAMVVISPVALRRDLAQTMLRWSRAWNRASGEHFKQKHRLTETHRGVYRFAEHKRFRRFCDATGLPAPFCILSDPVAAVAVRRDRKARLGEAR
jgi:GT2 family glycosyltransferase